MALPAVAWATARPVDSMVTPALPRSDSVSALTSPSSVNAPALARRLIGPSTTLHAPGFSGPLACVMATLLKLPETTAVGARLKLPSTTRLPPPDSVPPDSASPAIDEVGPSCSRPDPATSTCPPPVSAPPSSTEPVPLTRSEPPSVVTPLTRSEPPDTSSALAALSVSVVMLLVPPACDTAKPELMSASSSSPGTVPPQLTPLFQLRSPAALVNTLVVPELEKMARALSPAARR